jgi:hypothetical protein
MLQAFVQNALFVFRRMLQVFYRNITYVFTCCKRLFKMFYPFQTHVASVLSICCIYLTQMLHAFVPNVSSISDVCCSKFFLGVTSVFMFPALNGTARLTRRTSAG